MTIRAQRRIALSHLLGVEVSPVRIDPPADGRMTLHAVGLLMTSGAALHAPARCFAVLQQPQWLARVRRARAALRVGTDTGGIAMARSAKGLRVVARRAFRLARIRFARVTRDEVERVVESLPVALMTARTKTLLMAPRAVETSARGDRSVGAPEVVSVNAYDAQTHGVDARDGRRVDRNRTGRESLRVQRRVRRRRPLRRRRPRRPPKLHARRTAGPSTRKCVDRLRAERTRMACETARLRMARRTGLHVGSRLAAMSIREISATMRGRNGVDRGAARHQPRDASVAAERDDHRRCRRVHVTAGATLAHVTRRASADEPHGKTAVARYETERVVPCRSRQPSHSAVAE